MTLGQLVTKQVQLLTELLPSLSAVTVLSNPNNPNHRRATAMAQEAGQSLRKSVHSVRIETPSRYATAFAEITDARPDALLILPDPVLERGEVTQFALTARLPTMFTFGGPVVRAGGLIAYGPSLSDL